MNVRPALKPLMIFLLILFAGVGVARGWMTAQRAYEIKAGLPIDPPAACLADDDSGDDACKETLSGPYSALPIVQLPVATVGLAAHLVAFFCALALALALALGRRREQLWATAALGAAAAVAGLGSAVYLSVALALWTWCSLCMHMHLMTLLLLLTLGAFLLLDRRPRRPSPSRRPWLEAAACALIATSAWVGAAFGLDLSFFTRYEAASNLHKQLTPDYNALIQACRSGACVKPLVFDRDDLPDGESSLILSDSEGPVLVEMLDLSCPHCARYHTEFLAQWYKSLIKDKKVGLRVVLWPSGQACNEAVTRFRPASCEANNALLCAYHEAPKGKAAEKALAYMEAEFSLPTRQAPFPGGREAWLRENVSADAARCFTRELDKGTKGRLRKHVRAQQRLREEARKREGCKQSPQAWWCFSETPSFAVFADKKPRGSVDNADRVKEAAASVDRQRLLDLRDCLKP